MSDSPSEQKPGKGLPVPAGPVVDHAAGDRPRTGKARAGQAETPFEAQILGGGEKRGLRGGPETLGRAKSTYLQSEYSGPNDRRPRPGRVTKTEI